MELHTHNVIYKDSLLALSNNAPEPVIELADIVSEDTHPRYPSNERLSPDLPRMVFKKLKLDKANDFGLGAVNAL